MKGSAGIISDLSCKVLGKQIRTTSALERRIMGVWLAEMSSAENGLILSDPSVNFEPVFSCG